MGNYKRAIFWNIISQFGQSGITFLSTIILARILTPADFGLIGIVTIFIAFSQMMVDSEMGGALLRKEKVNLIDYYTLFLYNFIISIILYCILFICAPIISDIYSKPQLTLIIRIISITIIIHSFRVSQRIIILRSLQFKRLAIINIISGIISLVIAIILAKKGFRYMALVWQQVILAFTNVILMCLITNFIPSLKFSLSSFKYQFNFGIGLLGADTLQTIATNLTSNIIAKISNLTITGYYTQTSRITGFFQTSFNAILSQTIFPLMAKIKDIRKIKYIYDRSLLFIIITLSLITVIIIFTAPFLIKILLGDKWIESTWMLRILAISILPMGIQILCKNIMKVIGNTKMVFKIELIRSILIISLLLCSVFIDLYAIVWTLILSDGLISSLWLIITRNKLNHTILSD